MNFRISVFIIGLATLVAIFHSCIEEVEPEYDYQENIIFIDAYALTKSGISSVEINRTVNNFNTYRLEVVSNATVTLENEESGNTINFLEDSTGVYRCPIDFAATVGEVWKLYIELEDGTHFESKPQRVTAAVPIDDVKVEYSPEVTFDIGFNKFIPGHRVAIDWKDPLGENYYLWKYRIFEPLFVCKTCIKGIYRNGACQTNTSNFGPDYTDYLCDPLCWLIRYGDELPIFEDRLVDGAEITDREITIVPFLRRPDFLIEIQQMSLNKSAYDYFKIINDQIGENGGLNAPPPAALLGNLFNPDDPTELVLGQFTAAGVSTKNIFIDRSTIIEAPLRPDDPIKIENCVSCPVLFPCEEGSFRTTIKPDGWP